MPWVRFRAIRMLQDGVMNNVKTSPSSFNHCVRNHVWIAHWITVNLMNIIHYLICVFLECPIGWKRELIHGTPGQNCYTISSEEKTWHEAKQLCETTGGHLAHIEDEATSIFYEHQVYNYMLNYN